MSKIEFREKAFKILKSIERNRQLKINSALDNLRLGKFNSENIRKIQGTRHGHRLRVGRWRILFTLFQKEKRIEIVDIFLKKGKEDYGKKRRLL